MKHLQALVGLVVSPLVLIAWSVSWAVRPRDRQHVAWRAVVLQALRHDLDVLRN